MCIASAFYPNYYTDFAVKSEMPCYQKVTLDLDPFQTVRIEGLPADNPQDYQKDIELLFERYISDFSVYIDYRQ